MTGRILIIDTVPTNRVVLKVKMLAAQFTVDCCGTQAEALEVIATAQPDLILMNLSDPTEDRHRFCRDLKTNPDTAHIAVISIGVSDTAAARFAALDAGADDVLPRPINDTLLLARIRSLLRVRNAHQEIMLRDGTYRALGFDDDRSEFVSPCHAAILSAGGHRAGDVESMIEAPGRLQITHRQMDRALGDETMLNPDLFVIDGGDIGTDHKAVFQMIADIRSRSETRLASILIIVPNNQPETSALMLDLGADDAVTLAASKGEVTLRVRALLRQKKLQDKLRLTVRDGLHAAVTDPLTGLYNRRYLIPHLARMAEQSRRFQREFAVMILDIDHFKSINDTFGHAAGDQVLVGVSDRLKANLRAIDVLARIGGEEFLIAMPGTSREQAEAAADRLRRIVSHSPYAVSGTLAPVPVTVSVGVVVGGLQPLDRQGLDGLCERADAALYNAKATGRDKVTVAERSVA